MSDDKPKVVSLRLRRLQQLKEEGREGRDEVVRLADEITKLLGEQQLREVRSDNPQRAFDFACDQLLSLELSANALLRVLEHSLGPVSLNSVLVEVDRRKHHYGVEWPEHDQNKTYLGHLEDRKEPKEECGPGKVIQIRKEQKDE